MWPPGVVEAVCKVLASTDWPGLSGSEISRLLAMRGFKDAAPGASKWQRLEAAMQTRQQKDRASNCLIRFITDAMEPSRYVDDPRRFSALRDSLTEAEAIEAWALLCLNFKQLENPHGFGRSRHHSQVPRR